MKVYRSIAEASGALRGCAVAIGNFDGVHAGHRRLFELARAQVARRGAGGRPHLRAAPGARPAPRAGAAARSPRSRASSSCSPEAGLDATVVQPFDLAYAATEAADFVGRDLAGHLGAAAVVVGRDFTAGHEAAPASTCSGRCWRRTAWR